MHQWYKKVSKIHNTTTFFITHDIDEAILLSDKIYVMEGPVGHITEEFVVPYYEARNEEILLTEEFISLKRKIIRKIKQI